MRNQKKTEGRDVMARRDFLVIGSVAVAGAAAASSVSAGAIRAVAGPIGGSVLSIGFVDPNPTDASGVVAASRLALSDRELAGDRARLTIEGFWRPVERRNAPLSVNVSTFYDVHGVPMPMLAWGYHTSPQATFAASRSSFVVPTDRTKAISIGIERTIPGASAPASRFAALLGRRAEGEAALPVLETLARHGSICRLGGDVALQPGTYFIAVGDTFREKAPDWSSISYVPGKLEAHGAGVLRRGTTAVSFEYLMVSVERV